MEYVDHFDLHWQYDHPSCRYDTQCILFETRRQLSCYRWRRWIDRGGIYNNGEELMCFGVYTFKINYMPSNTPKLQTQLCDAGLEGHGGVVRKLPTEDTHTHTRARTHTYIYMYLFIFDLYLMHSLTATAIWLLLLQWIPNSCTNRHSKNSKHHLILSIILIPTPEHTCCAIPNQKSEHLPFCSQSPYRVGSGPLGPPNSPVTSFLYSAVL